VWPGIQFTVTTAGAGENVTKDQRTFGWEGAGQQWWSELSLFAGNSPTSRTKNAREMGHPNRWFCAAGKRARVPAPHKSCKFPFP